MMKLYLGGAAGLFLFGQSGAAPTGEQLLDQALAADPSIGAIMTEAGKLSSTGIDPTNAAVIVAVSGLAWKFLDTQQKSGIFITFNDWARRRLGLDNPPPPSPP